VDSTVAMGTGDVARDAPGDTPTAPPANEGRDEDSDRSSIAASNPPPAMDPLVKAVQGDDDGDTRRGK
jgi:hypothetical protein